MTDHNDLLISTLYADRQADAGLSPYRPRVRRGDRRTPNLRSVDRRAYGVATQTPRRDRYAVLRRALTGGRFRPT